MKETKTMNTHTASEAINTASDKINSDWFLLGAIGSIVASLVLHQMDKKEEANFVGHWAPTFLAFGLYSKLLKMGGKE